MIYLLSCDQWNVQYVGETTLPLHKKFNSHRKAKSGCVYVIKHLKDVCVSASFAVQMIEVFPGTGHTRTTRCVQLTMKLG